MFATALYLLAAISIEDLRREFPVLPADEMIVKDAVERWVGGMHGTMEDTIPIVVHFRDRRCVVLYLRLPSLGSDGVYCYNFDNQLIEVFTGAR